jgi:hypothetical protein
MKFGDWCGWGWGWIKSEGRELEGLILGQIVLYDGSTQKCHKLFSLINYLTKEWK